MHGSYCSNVNKIVLDFERWKVSCRQNFGTLAIGLTWLLFWVFSSSVYSERSFCAQMAVQTATQAKVC